MYILGVTG